MPQIINSLEGGHTHTHTQAHMHTNTQIHMHTKANFKKLGAHWPAASVCLI